MNEIWKSLSESIPAGAVTIIGLFAVSVWNPTNANANRRALAVRGIDAILNQHSQIRASLRGRVRAYQRAMSQAQGP